MFCSKCGQRCDATDKFCSNCGIPISSNCEKAQQYARPMPQNCFMSPGPSTSAQPNGKPQNNFMSPRPSTSGKIPVTVKSFSEFRKSKGKEWKAMVSKKQVDKEIQVQIMIGMMHFCEKDMRLKPKRGKRIALLVSNTAPYNDILNKAAEKFNAYHSDIFEAKEDYVLLLENGVEAQFIPGSSPKEFFTLKRYKEDLGKDYAKIVLYLCSLRDFHIDTDDAEGEEQQEGSGGEQEESSNERPETKRPKIEQQESSGGGQEESSDERPEPKKPKIEANAADEEATSTIQSDEAMARELQKQFDEQSDSDLAVSVFDDTDNTQKTRIVHEDSASVVRTIQKNVNQDGEFNIVVRRGAPLSRIVSYWQREARKSSPENAIRVQYCGENGIDTGALSQEFFSSVVQDIGKSMFPDGAPIDSLYNVQNKSFKTCGEIVAASLAQGGPPPSFLAGPVYELLLALDINLDQLDAGKHFTIKDMELFEQIRNGDPSDDFLSGIILDHGYTGPLNKAHQEDIIGTIQVSIISKRLLYLKEFCDGLKLLNVYAAVKDNAVLCKNLFVPNTSDPVDANYVFSLVSPQYSAEATSRRQFEEAIIDNLQDFLSTVEDKNITGYTEVLAWKEKNSIQDEAEVADAVPEEEKFQAVDVSPAGVLGWLTGQKHRPVNGELLAITAHFDHDCKERNPKHTICFPQVGACGREITFPVAHMTNMKEFEHVFLLALCKGSAFAKA